MKKITFLVAGLLLSGSLALASETTIFSGKPTPNYWAVDYREAEPVVFMERGIEFLVFPNGEMDFNTEPSQSEGVYYRSSREGNRTYGTQAYYNSRGVKVEHDYNGRVRRVGNVFINYDSKGRVKRIGTVYMSYNSFALSQIGNLRLIYNRSGHIVDAVGYINRNNRDYVYEAYYGGQSQSNGNGYQNDTRDNDDRYYRKPATGTRSTGK